MKRSRSEGRLGGMGSARIGGAFRRLFRRSKLDAANGSSSPAETAFRLEARTWNLWELERKAREESSGSIRSDEWAALFIHLRRFATPEGTLPKEFDELVRESFPELIQAA
jgi:hypothetical protein